MSTRFIGGKDLIDVKHLANVKLHSTFQVETDHVKMAEYRLEIIG